MTGEASAGARSLILGRIRDCLGRRPEGAGEEYGRITREYRQHGSLDPEQRLELLVDRLQHYQVDVYRCEAATLPRTIAETLAARGRTRIVVPGESVRVWLPPDLQTTCIVDEGLTNEALDGCEGVLTGCALAIADTGTIVLIHRGADGRRALTLVPDYHLCVVRQDQIVETVPEAIGVLVRSAPALVTTISGPSATADIEMTRIRGVHGPRTLDVIVVAR